MSHPDPILAFDTLDEPSGLEIIDRLEQLRYQLHTPEQVAPTTVPTEEFLFPVGKGIRIRTEQLVLPNPVGVFVRDWSGEMLTEVEHLESHSFPDGRYIIDLSTQIKTYMRIDGPVEITADLFEIRFTFDSETVVDIGFRSRHTRPAATVTTTTDPVDMMAAISTFGSALKSKSPERSFPTLRGHPPQIELGSSVEIPDGIDSPNTGIQIETPPILESLYPVAPLAYYLGAEVVPGNSPKLTTASGFEYGLQRSRGFEQTVERTLKQLFLLDCLTRTEGFYNMPLHERRVLDETLSLDWVSLYDQSIADRLETYLEVPWSDVADFVPNWRLTANVEPTSGTIEQLPFVVDDLAVVRTVTNPVQTDPDITGGATADASQRAVLTRSVSRSSESEQTDPDRADPVDEQYIEFEPSDSIEQGWIGDGIPIGASKMVTEAFYNRLDREVGVGDISITIVLNDTRMGEERDLVDAAYGDREHLPFDVTICRDLTVEELKEELQTDCDFFHYIGHTEPDGFECTDGKLDVVDLDHTEVDAFLLNACSSYHQGLALIEAGAIGGIVTLTDIINTEAVRMGECIARLLNTGFPLQAALAIAREQSILGGQYIVVGDGGMILTQAESRTPNLLEITPCEDGFTLDIMTFPTDTAGLGSIYTPSIEDVNEYFLSSGYLDRFHINSAMLREFLQLEEVPVRSDDEMLFWSSTVRLSDLR
ncbi:caspase family protein [Halobacteriaceae archaeon SHR40]|uniref:caspase family protein n=1 Tax=Halovenus amylolytica TaxID=2500550 RepID=UPI000FE3B874